MTVVLEGRLPIPAVGRPRRMRVPNVADTTLANGLRVLVARRPGIPRFECRLVVPVARRTASGDGPRLRVLSDTLMSGSTTRSSREIAEELQGMGAGLGTDADAEQLFVAGSCLSSFRRQFLALFGDVLLDPAYPADEVAIERDRIVQEIALLQSQPSVIAADALAHRMWGSHPYGWGTPDSASIAKVTPAVLRRLHRERVVPTDSLLVLVGDLEPRTTMADVEAVFGPWEPAPSAPNLPEPEVRIAPSVLLLDRDDAVQTTIRMGGVAVPRRDPGWPALALAATVFSGYFTSRLNNNIREQKGYTYGAHSRVEHRRMASQLVVTTDVGREVTAAALVEISYELGRMVALPVDERELEAAKRYLQGTLAMAIQTQAGLTAQLAALVSNGLPVEYLAEYPTALERVTVNDVQETSQRHLAPHALTTVLVGDSAVVKPAISPLVDVEV